MIVNRVTTIYGKSAKKFALLASNKNFVKTLITSRVAKLSLLIHSHIVTY